MSEVKWIKIDTDIFENEKMLLIDGLPNRDSIIVIWFKLLCFAGKQNNGGVFMINDKIAYTDEMLATILRRPIKTVRLALQTFANLGMIEMVDDTVTIPNWGKHQTLDAYERRKESDRIRQAKRREEIRETVSKKSRDIFPSSADVSRDNNVTVRNSSRDVTLAEEEKEKDIDYLERESIKRKKTDKRFSPPTVEEVKAYCEEKGLSVDAERFVDFYTSKGWKVGNSPMKDWRAACRNWAKRDAEEPKQEKREEGTLGCSFDEDEFFQAAMARSYKGVKA